SAELPIVPTTIIILNNTDKSVYLNNSLQEPSDQFFWREVLPAASGIPNNLALPNVSFQFSGYLPTPTDATKKVVVIFQGTSSIFNNRLPSGGGSFPTPFRS